MSLKLVAVFSDDNKRNSEFLINLGTLSQGTKLFRFKLFNIMVNDRKITEFVRFCDGIVIMVDCNNITSAILDRTDKIVQEAGHKPILFIIEKNGFCKLQFDPCKLFEKYIFVDYRKAFSIDNTQQIPQWEYDYPQAWFNDEVKKDRMSASSKFIDTRIVTTSAKMLLPQLVDHFERNSVPIEIWDHYCKLRLIFYSLGVYGYNRSIDRNGWLLSNWKKYDDSIGYTDDWNYTVNRFWVDTIYEIQKEHKYKTFDELYNINIKLWQVNLYKKYYSDKLLNTVVAKTSYVESDLT